MANPIRLSVVLAARNAADTLSFALQALHASDITREQFEIIVVDDASEDASATHASRYADTVVRLGSKPAGPAYARNRGAELARGAFIAFVDADVIVRPDTLSRMLSALTTEPQLDVVSARYGRERGASGLVSQYWNLLVSYADERQQRRGGTAVSGCVMMRRSLFESIGMFDEWRFRTPCLEDVELAQRLAERGSRISSLPGLEVTHLRKATVRRVLGDVWERSELLARSLGYKRTRASAPNDIIFVLNGATVPAVAMLTAIVLTAAASPASHWMQKAVVAFIIGAVANLPACVYFARKRGPAFALLVLPLHMLAQAAAVSALTVGWLLRDTIGDRIPDATMQAFAEVGVEMWPPIPRRS